MIHFKLFKCRYNRRYKQKHFSAPLRSQMMTNIFLPWNTWPLHIVKRINIMLAFTPFVCIAVTSTCNSRFSFFQLHECLAQVVTENLHIKRWLFKMDNEFGGRGTGTELSFILRIILGLNLVSFWSNTGPIRRCPYWTSCENYSSELTKLFGTTKVILILFLKLSPLLFIIYFLFLFLKDIYKRLI